MDDNDLQERKTFLAQVDVYINQNDYPAALDLARSRLNRMPGDLDARLVICRIWIQQGRLDETRDMLCEMEEILASLSSVYACMGDICLKKGMQDSAENFYRKFILLNPGAPLARDISMRLKEIEAQQNTSAIGEDEGDRVGQVPPDFQTMTLAELYIRQGHLTMAEEVLETILRKDPQQEKTAERLAEVREMIRRAAAAKRSAPVIAELLRWLDNISGLRAHAA
jgi:tetratricopeptide (TPR) repeat protein